jgi:RNAse (barnase) inhibitor barstar
MSKLKTYIIDGNDFSTLPEFFEVVGRILIPGVEWGHNLDAFNDILGGGFGTPDEGFGIVWKNSKRSQIKLGYEETVRVLLQRLAHCHPANRKNVTQQIEDARNRTGSTVFDWLVEIFRDHGIQSTELEYKVDLTLE